MVGSNYNPMVSKGVKLQYSPCWSYMHVWPIFPKDFLWRIQIWHSQCNLTPHVATRESQRVKLQFKQGGMYDTYLERISSKEQKYDTQHVIWYHVGVILHYFLTILKFILGWRTKWGSAPRNPGINSWDKKKQIVWGSAPGNQERPIKNGRRKVVPQKMDDH